MSTVKQRDEQLNAMIQQGKLLEAFEEFYADDVVMQEPAAEPVEGKDANREREKEFLSSVEEVHGIELRGSAANDEVSFSEWRLDLTFKDGNRVEMEQVARRRWSDGRIVHERFYHPGQ